MNAWNTAVPSSTGRRFPTARKRCDISSSTTSLSCCPTVDNASFAHSNAKLEVEFDAVYTAEDVGSYKPSQRNFDYMIEQLGRLGIAKKEILHTAESMFHDHGPANECGLAGCWIYRRHDQPGFGATMNPGDMPRYEMVFNSMADLVKAHQAEQGSVNAS